MKRKALILGAGITGLAAGWQLAEAGYDVVVVEKEDAAGGQARTIKHNGFMLDLGAHKIFTVMEHVQKILEDLAGDELLVRPKKGRIRYGERYLPFPVGVKDMVSSMPFKKLMFLTLSLMKARISNIFIRKNPTTYEEWFVVNYGRAIYEEFVKEATEKIWGVASNLSADLAKRRVTSPTLWELLKQYLLGVKINRVTSADTFYYPKHGCQIFVDRLRERIEARGGHVLLSTTAAKVTTRAERVTDVDLSTGEKVSFGEQDVLITTIPKRSFAKILDRELPGEVDYALTLLRERNLLLVYIMLKQEHVMEENWIFYPEREFLFNRIFEQKNCSPYMVPEGHTVLCAEMTCHADQRYSAASRKYIVDRMIDSLHQIGLIKKENVCDTYTIFLEHAYPLWDVMYKERLETVLRHFDRYSNLYSVGRQGGFVYGGIADCMDIGLVTARFIASGAPHEKWAEERKKFDRYVVID